MISPTIKFQLAAITLHLWEKEMPPLTPDQHINWQRLLEQLPEQIPPDDLCAALCVLVAKKPVEQHRFKALFADALKQTDEINQVNQPFVPYGDYDKIIEEQKTDHLLRAIRWIMAIVLIGIGVDVYILLDWGNNIPLQPPQFTREFQILAKSSANLCPEQSDLAKMGKIGTVKFSNSSSNILKTKLGEYHIKPKESCVSFNAGKKAGRDSIRLVYQTTNGTQITFAIIANVSTGRKAPKLSPATDQNQYIFEAHAFPFDHDKRLLDQALPMPGATDAFIKRYSIWLKAGLLLLLGFLLFLMVRYRALKRRKFVARRERSDKPPYIWNIKIPNLPPPDPEESFAATLNLMRHRTTDPSSHIDISATVQATIRRGGMVDFQYKKQTRPPEYLLLIDQQDARDHRARLYDQLYQAFQDNNVLIERLFFDGDIRNCYNHNFPEGLRLDELLSHFPDRRLLIISTGRRFFSPVTGKAAKWTERFQGWKQRALLTPLPSESWTVKEKELSELFQFAPATLQGIQDLLNIFDQNDDELKINFDELVRTVETIPIVLEGSLIETLEKYFPDEGCRIWIAACAVYPELHYDLTLWIGQWLEQWPEQKGFSRIVTVKKLTGILRLPWFISGEMPPAVQLVLIEWLENRHPQLLKELHIALIKLLSIEKYQPPKESAAWDDFSMRLTLNEWQVANDKKQRKKLESQIADMVRRGIEPDFTALRLLNRPRENSLDFLVPKSWVKVLYKGKMPGLGLHETWKDVFQWALPVWIVSAFLTQLYQPVEGPVCLGEKVEYQYKTDNNKIMLCLGDEQSRLLYWEYLTCDAAEDRALKTVDSLLKADVAAHSAANQTLLQECRQNIANACYNAGVTYYKEAVQLSPKSKRAKLAGYALARSKACDWFSRAVFAKPTASWIKRANNWCANEPVPSKVDISPLITGLVLDSVGEFPLANVHITGLFTDTHTDSKGKFQLKVPKDLIVPIVTLRFEMPGYRPYAQRFMLEGTNNLIPVKLIQSKGVVGAIITVDPPKTIDSKIQTKETTQNNTHIPLRISNLEVSAIEVSDKNPNKSRKTTKASKTDRLEVRFDILPVNGVLPGEQQFDIQLIRPDNSNTGRRKGINQETGQAYIYEFYKKVLYVGQPEQAFSTYDNALTPFVKGDYIINVWHNGTKIKSVELTLR